MAVVLSSMVLCLRLLLGLARKISHYHDSVGDFLLAIVLFNLLPERLVTKNTKKLFSKNMIFMRKLQPF